MSINRDWYFKQRMNQQFNDAEIVQPCHTINHNCILIIVRLIKDNYIIIIHS